MEAVIRPVVKEDIPDLKRVIDSSELFPSEMLDDMIADYLNNPNTNDVWFTATEENIPVALGYCAPEKLAEGTYNLYAIAIQQGLQGKGIGKMMMAYVEDYLRKNSKRILIVETSGDPEFESTRQFYKSLNYTEEAVIRDFWAEGEDKVVFWKKL